MATRSRTYLPTDWQVWTYKPVAGKFRLDFSALNGADVLGAIGDVGSIQTLDIDITGIQITDGGQPNNGVFGVYNPGTMTLSSQFKTWNAAFIKELYNGKEIYITLKNETTYSDPVFGKNTVYFIGSIDSLTIDVDPINLVTSLTVTATDVAGAAMNFPVIVRRTEYKGMALALAIADARNAGQISPFINSTFLLGSLATSWETIAGKTFSNLTIGEGIDEYIAAEVATVATRYLQDNTGTIYLYFEGETIAANSKIGRLIPDSIISNLVIGQDGANVPTAFNLSNSVASYQYGGFADSQLSNPTIYTSQLDVPTASLKIIADQTALYQPAIQPTEVTIKSAQSFQTITFDNTLYGSDYFYPSRHYWSGEEVKTTPAFTGGTYYHTILGTSHTITPDDWQTTYQLWKGTTPAALVNLVDNGSATTTTLTGWTGVARTTATYNTAPASWAIVYDGVNDWYQGNFYKPTLVVGQRYSVSFWAKSVVPGTVIYTQFDTGVAFSSLNITPSTTVWTYYKIENQLCTTNTNLSIIWNAPADPFYIDDVAVVLGPTAI